MAGGFAIELFGFCRWAARALFGRDGLDDEAAGLGGVDGLGREFEGLGDEVLHGGRVKERRRLEDDVSGLLAVAGEKPGRIAKASAVDQEKEADPAREERNGEDRFGGAIGGAEADGEGVVVVVNEFDGSGETGAHFTERGAGLGSDVGGELVEEGVELGSGRFCPGEFLCGGFPFGGCGFAGRHGLGEW